MSSTTNTTSNPCPAAPAISAGLKVDRPVRRKMRFIPASGRARETKPSAAICSVKPRWSVTKRAEAAGSATFRDRADEVIGKAAPWVGSGNSVRSTPYIVRLLPAREIFSGVPGSLGSEPVAADAQRGDGGGQTLVLVDQQHDLDQAALVVVCGQGGPVRVVDVAGGDQLVDGGQQGAVPVRPGRVRGAGADPVEDLRGDARASAKADVVVGLVFAGSQVGHAQDDQFGFVAREPAAR